METIHLLLRYTGRTLHRYHAISLLLLCVHYTDSPELICLVSSYLAKQPRFRRDLFVVARHNLTKLIQDVFVPKMIVLHVNLVGCNRKRGSATAANGNWIYCHRAFIVTGMSCDLMIMKSYEKT